MTCCSFTYNLYGRYHSAQFTEEETEVQEGELVGISVSPGFDMGFTGCTKERMEFVLRPLSEIPLLYPVWEVEGPLGIKTALSRVQSIPVPPLCVGPRPDDSARLGLMNMQDRGDI